MYPDYLMERYYPVYIGKVFALGIELSESSNTEPFQPFGWRRISCTHWFLDLP